jgi:transposase
VHAADIPSTDKQKKNKTDLHDSRSISEHLEKGNLHGIHILTHEQQELRSLFRFRESKVVDVTRANNRLKSFLMYYGIYLSKKALEWLDLELACAAGTIALQQHIEELKYQRKQLFQLTKLLREQIQAFHNTTYKCLLSVPGIGPVTAMGLIAEIADFTRFADPDEYSSYLGLCPWPDSSGDTIKTKGMQPRCNNHLRPLLIEASWTAIKRSRTLFAFYSKHNGKNGKKAIVKVARKLAMIAKGVATTGQPYQDDYLKKKQLEQQNKKERFFSGIAEQHVNKQPGNELVSMPG